MRSSECTASDLHDGPCDACKGRDGLEAKILDEENHIAQLEWELITRKTAQNASHDRLVRKLPYDIISLIFEVYVNIHFENADFPFFSLQKQGAPLRLGAVCHTWRTIAWALPCLWTRISFNVCHCIQYVDISELALQWLGRTGQLPLSICLYQNDHGNVRIQKVIEESRRSVVHALCAVFPRWETLDISIGQNASGINMIVKYWPAVSQGWRPAGDVEDSSLRHLRLQGLSSKFTAILLSRFRTSSSLLQVTFKRLESSPNLHNFNSSNLVAFDACPLSWRRCLLIMQAIPSLREFSSSMTKYDYDNDLQQHPTHVVCPALHSLTLLEDQNSMLDFLTLPSLTKLHYGTLKLKPRNTSKAIDSLLSLIGRSHCQLTSLCLLLDNLIDGLLRLLQAMNSLESLSWGYYRADNKPVLTYLSTTSSDGSVYLPHLKELPVLHLLPTFSWTTLLDIYDPSGSYTGQGSVPETPNGLRRRSLKLTLYVVHPWDEDHCIDQISLHRISNLIDQGIKLSIEHPRGDFIAYSYKKLAENNMARVDVE